MQSTTSVTQSVFVNKQSEQVKNNNPQQASQNKAQAVAIEGEFVKRGDQHTQHQAEDVFARSHEFANMESVSFSVKNGLQAYTSMDLAIKKDEISRLMGVDLFA